MCWLSSVLSSKLTLYSSPPCSSLGGDLYCLLLPSDFCLCWTNEKHMQKVGGWKRVMSGHLFLQLNRCGVTVGWLSLSWRSQLLSSDPGNNSMSVHSGLLPPAFYKNLNSSRIFYCVDVPEFIQPLSHLWALGCFQHIAITNKPVMNNLGHSFHIVFSYCWRYYHIVGGIIFRVSV